MANNWAIVVGVNDYDFLPEASLNFAVRDARAMRVFLCRRAGFPKQQILLCGDGTAGTKKATRSVLRDILLHQIQRAKNADNLWFFFSGHGLNEHLMPIDGNLTDLRETAISIQFVTEQLRACKAKNVVLVLDMCRDESGDAGHKSAASIQASVTELAKAREGQQGIITLFSCGRGESSYEIASLKQGAFTHALLEGLGQKTILKDLARYLERRVPELHRESGKIRKQVPLVIPEPDWKSDEPILSHYATPTDVGQLKEMAIDAECDGDIEKAIRSWEQVNLLAEKRDDRQRAMNKIKQLSTNQTRVQAIPIVIGNHIESTVPESYRQHQIDAIPLKKPIRGNWAYLSSTGRAKLEAALIKFYGFKPRSIHTQVNMPIDRLAIRKIRCGYQWVNISSIRKMFDHLEIELLDEDIIRGSDLILVESERGGDYRKLRDLLKAGRWEEADQETCNLMQQVCGKQSIRVNDLKMYPLESIEEIDRIWAEQSSGKFGFKIQAQIWQQCDRDENEFELRVGWRTANQTRQKPYKKLTFDPAQSEPGHLPAFFKSWGGGGWSWTSYLLDRVCEALFISPVDYVLLESAKGVDYRKLRDLLKAGQWEEADRETYRLMIVTVGKEEGQSLHGKDLENFPCADLLAIDQLWVAASNGHFGFSIQKKIWEECGSPRGYTKLWEKFGDRVGWRKNGEWQLNYSDLQKDVKLSPVGEFPSLGVRSLDRYKISIGGGVVSHLLQRLVKCNTPQS